MVFTSKNVQLGWRGTTFNQRGRASVATGTGGTANYVYNALGQMIEKYGTGATSLIVYDEAGHLLGEYSSTGALLQETIWMGDTPIATLRPNGSSISAYYVHTDQLNAPRVITQPSTNTIAWRWDTDPFGSAAPDQNPASLGTFTYNLRFPGQYYQAETGINYNYARDYDPQTGRYIEPDPIGLAGGSWSTYAYVGGNPVSFVDRLGLSQSCPTCQQSFIDCLANCIRKYDPLSDSSKFGLTALGGTFPKSWIGLGRGLGGASPVTTVPSAVAYGTGGGAAGTAGAIARALGRVASPIWITYGLYLSGMEVWCATSCAGDNCAH